MKLKEVVEILEADVIQAETLDLEIRTACGSDMMSDVLAYVKERGLLLTGLLNPQTVRTAEMMDMRCICFVRGKRPGSDTVELAKKRGIAVIATGYCLFDACGKLYEAGLVGGMNKQ